MPRQGAALIAIQHEEDLGITEMDAAVATAKEVESFELWHRRFGHLGYGKLQYLYRVTRGLRGPIGSITSNALCELCVYAKKT